MDFKVVLAPLAIGDLDETTLRIATESGTARAGRWREDVFEGLESLRFLPSRFAVRSELSATWPVRAFPVHSHRILYVIDEVGAVVRVLRIWHTARRDPLARELAPEAPDSHPPT